MPAVSIAHVEHVLKGRDKLTKRNNTNAFISDDGFPLGVVFMLRILGISDDFNSLNWFDSVNAKFTVDLANAETKKTKQDTRGAPNAFEDYE